MIWSWIPSAKDSDLQMFSTPLRRHGLWRASLATPQSGLALCFGLRPSTIVPPRQTSAIHGSERDVPDFITIKDVCELLKLSERTVYNLCREGKLGGAAKVGNQWRIDREELLAWLKTGGAARFRTKDNEGGEEQGDSP